MFDYRLFFPSSTLDGAEAPRRPQLGHHGRRVHRLAPERHEPRSKGRR